MALMRAHNRQGALHSDGLRAGLRVGGAVENGGLMEYFFGKDGKKCLQHEKFVQFLRNLHDEVCPPTSFNTQMALIQNQKMQTLNEFENIWIGAYIMLHIHVYVLFNMLLHSSLFFVKGSKIS